MADIVYLDFSSGVQRVMNNAKLYVKLLGKFRDDTKFGDLETAFSAGDLDNALSLAHTIKGVAANLSLSELFKQSLELENQLKAKTIDPNQLEILKSVLDATLLEIDKVISENG